MKNEYEKVKRDYQDYIKLRREIELYTSGKIKRLLENYYAALSRGGSMS